MSVECLHSTMEDEFDIYGDLDKFENEHQEKSKAVQDLLAQIEELKGKIVEKEQEKQTIASKNEILLENISTLLLTAKAELKRKDNLIADVRRERDNVAFRRRKVTTRGCDKATQTVLVHTVDQETQTTAPKIPKPEEDYRQERRWRRERSQSVDVHIHRDRFKMRWSMEKPQIRTDRLRGRRDVLSPCRVGDRKYRTRTTGREKEREKEQRIRRSICSPKQSTVRSGVRFKSPYRVPKKEVSVPDSASEIDISSTFIPMSEVELDRYVKEISRSGRKSPQSKYSRTRKLVDLDTPLSEMWDNPVDDKSDQKSKRTSSTNTNEEPRKLVKKSPKKAENIIQSDEIGTSASLVNYSPPIPEVKERRLSKTQESPPVTLNPIEDAVVSSKLLDSTSTKPSREPIEISQPPKIFVPPVEQPIVEQVPTIPLDEETKLNDSRELKIIEMEEQTSNDNGNTSADTVIEIQKEAVDEDLEEGEWVSPVPSPSNEIELPIEIPKPTFIEEKLVEKPLDSTSKSPKKKKDKKAKTPPPPPPEKQRKSTRQPKKKTPSKEPKSTEQSRSKQSRKKSPAKKPVRKPKSPTPEDSKKSKRHRKQSETLKDLFGTDDENSNGDPVRTAKRALSPSPEPASEVKKVKNSPEYDEVEAALEALYRNEQMPEPQRLVFDGYDEQPAPIDDFVDNGVETVIQHNENHDDGPIREDVANEEQVQPKVVEMEILVETEQTDQQDDDSSRSPNHELIELPRTEGQETDCLANPVEIEVNNVQDLNSPSKQLTVTEDVQEPACLVVSEEIEVNDQQEVACSNSPTCQQEESPIIHKQETESSQDVVCLENPTEDLSKSIVHETDAQEKPEELTEQISLENNKEEITQLHNTSSSEVPDLLDEQQQPQTNATESTGSINCSRTSLDISLSNKYSEFRVELDNEEEMTVILTRKKRKKKCKAGT